MNATQGHWYENGGAFSYLFTDSERETLYAKAKLLAITYFSILGVPSILGLLSVFITPVYIPGGATIRGVLIVAICAIPALLVLPYLRRRIIGSYSHAISEKIIDLMGADMKFAEPLNEVFLRTPWSKARITLYGGYREAPEDIPIYLPNGRCMLVNFYDDPFEVTLQHAPVGPPVSVNPSSEK